MSLKLGTLDVLDARLGTAAVARLVLGTEQVWPSGPLVPTGRVLAVESPDTAEIVGTVLGPVVGLVAAVEGPHVGDLAGTVTLPGVTGTIAVIEADDLASIVGASTAPPGVVVGPVVVVEADDLVAIVGTVAAPVYTGTIVALDDDDLAAIVGTVDAPVYTGAIVAVEAGAFAALVGTSSAPVYTGVISVAEADDASTIAGSFGPTGTVAVTEDADTSTITGTFAGTSAAPTLTHVTAGGGAFTHGNTRPPINFALPSFAVTTGELLVVSCGNVTSDNPATPSPMWTLTGGGLTWTKVEAIQSATFSSTCAVWTAVATSTTSITNLVVTTARGTLGVLYTYAKVTGQAASPIGATAALADGTADGQKDITLSATPAANSLIYAFMYANMDDAPTTKHINPGTTDGWTEVVEYGPGGLDQWGMAEGQRITGWTNTRVRWDDINASTGASAYSFAGVAVEIKAP